MKKKLLIFLGGIILAFFLLIFMSITIIQPGERGILIQLGAIQKKTLYEGIHFRVPLISQIKRINVKVQKNIVKGNTAASKDLQSVITDVAMNYHIDSEHIIDLYRNVGSDYDSIVIDPAIPEIVKMTTALFTAEELIQKRQEVAQLAKETIQKRLEPYYLIVDNISFVNFSYSAEFDKAIEEKQVAKQKAEKAKNDLERVKAEGEQIVAKAESEAKELKSKIEAIKQQGGNEYLRMKEIEVQLEYAKKWDGKLPVNLYGSAPIPLLNLDK